MAKTSKYISSISYNTKKFLLDKLDSLIYQRIIVYYEFIKHYPDEDDKKEHFHLFVMPNQSLDLGLFKDLFEEYSFKFSTKILKFVKFDYPILTLSSRQSYKNKKKFKPLGCMPFRVTHKYGDWYYYVLHNTDYLRSKELVRNKFYNDKDIFTSDLDFHNQLVLENKLEDFCTMGDVQLFKYCFNGIQNDISLSKLLSTGYVPLNKVNQFKTLYMAISSQTIKNLTIDNTNHNIDNCTLDSESLKISHTFKIVDKQLPFKDDLFD